MTDEQRPAQVDAEADVPPPAGPTPGGTAPAPEGVPPAPAPDGSGTGAAAEPDGPTAPEPAAALAEPGDAEPGDREPDDAGAAAETDDAETDDTPWSEDDDDRTDETLAWLRRKRRAHRRARGKEMAVVAYTVAIALAGYGSSFAVSFFRGLRDGSGYAHAASDLRAGMPALFVFGALALALVAARDALWRGPVVVPGPTAGWLLAQPVKRERVLRPWFRLTAGLAAGAGVLGGLAGAAVLRVTGLAPLGKGMLAALPAALCLPLLAVALAMAVERRPAWARAVARWTPAAVLLLAALAAQAVLAAQGHRSPALEQIELWSGPWGWAAQPVVHAIHTTAVMPAALPAGALHAGAAHASASALPVRPGPATGAGLPAGSVAVLTVSAVKVLPATGGATAPAWPVALALLVAATAAALVAAHRDAGLVPTVRLRERAATAATVSSVAWSLELRAAKLAIMARTDAGSGVRLRLRPPRGRHGRHLLVAWRDLLTLLRTPGRLGKAAVWTACGAAVAGLGADLGGERRWVGLVLGLLLGYLAVGTLAEPARLETDDVRRAAWATYRFRTLMLHHGIVPAVLGAGLGLLAAVPYAVAGHPAALLLIPVCAPPFTAAALVSAARGPARTQLLFLGGNSPVGGPGPLIFLAWYAAGPLLSVAALTLALAGPPARAVVTALLVTVLLALLAARMSDRLVRH
jgi:hypothetical protein